MGAESGAVENRQALASFPADQRPNPVRFALLAPAGGGICSNSFIHSLHKNKGQRYYRPCERILEVGEEGSGPEHLFNSAGLLRVRRSSREKPLA